MKIVNGVSTALALCCLSAFGCGGSAAVDSGASGAACALAEGAVSGAEPVAEPIPEPIPEVEDFGAGGTGNTGYCVRKILTVQFGTDHKVGDYICLDCFTPCGAAGTVVDYRKLDKPNGKIIQLGSWVYISNVCIECPASGASGLERF